MSLFLYGTFVQQTRVSTTSFHKLHFGKPVPVAVFKSSNSLSDSTITLICFALLQRPNTPSHSWRSLGGQKQHTFLYPRCPLYTHELPCLQSPHHWTHLLQISLDLRRSGFPEVTRAYTFPVRAELLLSLWFRPQSHFVTSSPANPF